MTGYVYRSPVELAKAAHGDGDRGALQKTAPCSTVAQSMDFLAIGRIAI